MQEVINGNYIINEAVVVVCIERTNGQNKLRARVKEKMRIREESRGIKIKDKQKDGETQEI